MSAYRVWCVGGFLFPIAIWAVGFVFERGHPPSREELAQAWVSPGFLNALVIWLLLAHLVAAIMAVSHWRRIAVLAATFLQVMASLLGALVASLAVRGVRGVFP
jgi:hypothetical protein